MTFRVIAHSNNPLTRYTRANVTYSLVFPYFTLQCFLHVFVYNSSTQNLKMEKNNHDKQLESLNDHLKEN